MALGIRGGMGVEARELLKKALGLKLSVFHSCDTHDCKTHGNWAGGGEVKKNAEEDPFGVSRPSKNRARLGKLVEGVPGVTGEELAELRSVREKVVTGDRLKFQTFPGERGPIRGQVNVSKAEVWLTREEFMSRKGRYGGRLMTAAERYAQPDLHGLVVRQGGRYLDPFEDDGGSSHAVIRLHQTGMPKLINRVVPKVTGEEALSVELKPGRVEGSNSTRFKNRIYLIAGERGGTKVALNVVIYPDGRVKTAFIEKSDGNYGDTATVRRFLKEAGVKIPNEVVPVSEFGVERVTRNRRR
jgi:hypothetical protein